MAGVRRWIGTQSSIHSDGMRRKAQSAALQTKPQSYGKTDVHSQSSGVLASCLLDPKVPQEELLEYHRYIDQCQLMQDAMHGEAEATDQSLYMRFVERNTGKGDLVLADGTAELYEVYMLSASSELVSSDNKILIDIYDYKHWLMDVVLV
ncbi:hypothetical protein BS17DRAFT_426482 [Gyrodon lividus]|nr:hypothetical protein BS17DRAFT_426482 [Gyrodon lividus]